MLVTVSLPAWSEGEALPDGAIKRGTLANAKLIIDAKLGVAAKVESMGCAKPERVESYIAAMPAGPVGQRQWKELWVISGCDSRYPVNIEFKESGQGGEYWKSGQGGVYWTIK